MGFHALQSMTEHSPTVNLYLTFPGDDGALDAAPRPKVVVHAAPGFFGVCAIIAGSCLSTLEARGSPGEFDIDQTAVVDCSLDCVRRTVLTQLYGNTICVERVMALIEAVIRQRVTGPQERLLVIGIEELGVELHCRTCTEDIVVYDLEEANMASVRKEIEGLRLDIGVVQRLPFQVLLGQLGESRVACILSNRLDGLRAIDGLLSTGNRRQPARM